MVVKRKIYFPMGIKPHPAHTLELHIATLSAHQQAIIT
jgi:hypothetical protein